MSDREQLFQHIRELSEDDLIDLLRTLDRPALKVLHAHFGIRDCDCPIEVLPSPDCTCEGKCNCRIAVARCPHVDDSKPTLPLRVESELLRLMQPKVYDDRPLPCTPTMVTHQDAKVTVMANRQRRGEAIWHPADLVQRKDEVPDRLGRTVHRMRNGVAKAERQLRAVAV